MVGDLSFIPLGLVLPALARCAASDADLVVMVKPQFEVGKERLGSGGVVRSEELRAETVREVARRAWGLGARRTRGDGQSAAPAWGTSRTSPASSPGRRTWRPIRCGCRPWRSGGPRSRR
ncbi:hypothetical protein SCYAM73S_03489 [Streptomyces cyaneofuscatus]